MEYDKVHGSYMDYVNKCRFMIKNMFFTKEDFDDINVNIDEVGVFEIVKKHRLKMINIKLEHTMRMVEQVVNISINLGLKIDLDLVVKVAILYHDIGRIRQATWCNTFGDSIYLRKNMPFKNHGEEGYDIFLNNDFNVDEKYIPIIGETILHHQDHHTQSKLNYQFKEGIENININDIVTGSYNLNDAEWQVASLIVQLVADIDKCDILYQHLTDDFEMIRDYVFDRSMKSLDDISVRWGVSKSEITEYNRIDEKNYEPMRIKVPIKNMSLDKLELPQYMKNMFYDNSWPQLRELIKDEHWHFISMLWWRLSHFLNQISFSSTLINIEESKLLEQIYEKIPVRLRPLVAEAFEYAKEVFIEEKIEQNKGKIYLK